MNLDRYILLVYKDLKGEITPIENEELIQLRTKFSEREDIERDIRDTWNSPLLSNEELEEDLTKLNQRIDSFSNKPIVLPLWKKIAGIAAVFIALLAALFVFTSEGGAEMQSFVASVNTNVTLPDGSIVQVAAGSEISYAKSFDEERRVELQGRAYFDVERDESRPFIVNVGDVKVQVLGTEFNIEQRTENTIVAVTEGSVRVRQEDDEVDLVINEMVSIVHSGEMVKNKVRTHNFNYWVDGQFIFEEMSLEEIMQELSLIFGLEIIILEENMRKCVLSAVVNGTEGTDVVRKIATKYGMQLERKREGISTLLDGLCK